MPMRMRALLSAVLLLLAASKVCGQATPLDYEYYAKFPNHGDSSMAPPLVPAGVPAGTHLGLQRFYELLRRMRDARDELRTYCIGPRWEDMVRTVRGTKVLIWPERFADCERDANLLDKGDPLFTMALANWNKIYGTNYALPRGEPADVQAWSRRKGEFLHFVDLACNEASRSMVLAGDPGFSEPPKQVFERARKRCPASWVRLFEPEEAIKKREDAAKRVCRPGTTYMVATTTGPDKPYETCDEDDKYVPPEKPPGGSSSASKPVGPDDLERELSALARGEYDTVSASELLEDVKRIIGARRQLSPDAAESLRQQLAAQPKAGWFGGVEIFGGRTGKLFEALLDPSRTAEVLAELQAEAELGSTLSAGGPASGDAAGCDDARYAQQAADFVASRSSAMAGMQTEPQQCALSRMYAQGLRNDIAYAARCKPAALPALQKAVTDVNRQEKALCGGQAGAGGASSSSSRKPTTCFEAMMTHTHPELCRPTIIPGRK